MSDTGIDVAICHALGCFGGALLALLIGEKLGRKRMLIVFTIVMGTGIVLQTVSTSMTEMIWGRIIAGIGNGGNTATAPVWHVETSRQSKFIHDSMYQAVALTVPQQARKERRW